MAKDPNDRVRHGPDPSVRQIGQAYSLVTTLTGPMLVGGLIDWLANTLPWGLLSGVVLGAAMSLVVLVKMTQPKGPPR